jgi:hypothetical protein
MKRKKIHDPYESLFICQYWVVLLFLHFSEALVVLRPGPVWLAIVAGMNVACICIVVSLRE